MGSLADVRIAALTHRHAETCCRTHSPTGRRENNEKKKIVMESEDEKHKEKVTYPVVK